MKRTLLLIALCAFVFAGTSCNKDTMSPEYLDEHPSETAKISITRAGSSEKVETTFLDMGAYRESDIEGQSWIYAWSDGKSVYDTFMLSLYFECIDNLKVGDTIIPSRCSFSFVPSSDSNATTNQYAGKIRLADKGSDYVILHFDNVVFNCPLGEYTIDGYRKCPLYELYIQYYR